LREGNHYAFGFDLSTPIRFITQRSQPGSFEPFRILRGMYLSKAILLHACARFLAVGKTITLCDRDFE